MKDDAAHMRAAIALAARGLGSTWPNPSVGCVIVRDGAVVGRGRTATGGRPHAEIEALRMAGEAARGATAYVTLEPCSHFGQTRPCVNALMIAGIARVVVAHRDPDPRVNGEGLRCLAEFGRTVESDFLAEEAIGTLRPFFCRIANGRPLVTLKLATTLDGRIATRGGESQWITGPRARREGQALRGRHDAVMAGLGTVLADDPALTCRLAGFADRPTVRIVADSRLGTPLTARLVTTAAENPTWILHCAGADARKAAELTAAGVTLIETAGSDAGVDLVHAFQALGRAGLTSVLVEGGARLAASMLRSDLIDQAVWFHAPMLLGGDALPAIHATGIDRLEDAWRWLSASVRETGGDVMTTLVQRDY